MPTKIVVVDDDRDLCELLTAHFGTLDWAVVSCMDSHCAVATILTERPELVILDVIMAGIDGITLCRLIRERSSVPILLLSARNEPFDRIIGLRAGADDYMGKPFEIDELEERVRAILRRTHVAPSYGSDRTLTFGGLRFDIARRTISYQATTVALSPMEADLLEKLVRSPRRMLSREELGRDVWHSDSTIPSRTIDVHVQRLRKKMRQAGEFENWIVTIKGGGYEFAPLENGGS